MKPARRQIFVLTPEEKKAALCVLAAFTLGLATRHYREAHPHPAAPPSAKQQYQAQRAAKGAAAYARSARGQKAADVNRPSQKAAAADDDGEEE